MNVLNTYRNQIVTILAGLTTGNGYSFTSVTQTAIIDDPEQVAEANFPRSYVYTPPNEQFELTLEDITTERRVMAPVIVDTWRKLSPAQSQSTICDQTAADVIECIMKNSYWTTNENSVLIDVKNVSYNYVDFAETDEAAVVSVRFELEFVIDVTST